MTMIELRYVAGVGWQSRIVPPGSEVGQGDGTRWRHLGQASQAEREAHDVFFKLPINGVSAGSVIRMAALCRAKLGQLAGVRGCTCETCAAHRAPR